MKNFYTILICLLTLIRVSEIRASVGQVNVSRIDKIQIGGTTVDSIKRIKTGGGIARYVSLSSDSLSLVAINSGSSPFSLPNGAIVYMPEIDQFGRVVNISTTNATPSWSRITDTPTFFRFSQAVDSLLKRQVYSDTNTYDATKHDLSSKINFADTSAWDATRSWVLGLGYTTNVGTLTSVGIASSDFTISGSPVTTSGNITANLNTSGVTAGFYGGVTVTNKGIVTAGKRQEKYSGTTDGSGTYTVVFGTPYSVVPNIQANIVNQSNTNQNLRVTSVSTTGFTVNAFQRNSVNLLGIDVLLSATVNVSGASVDVIINEK